MIAIIDYDAGNIKSVEKAFQLLGEEVILTRDRDVILGADGVVLPGVGAFGDAMEKLRHYGLEEVIHEVVRRNIPFLGICLGLQLMFERSDESPGVEGLGLLQGEIIHIPEDCGLKIPHIGWNSLKFPVEGRLFQGIEEDAYVYFVHSYYLKAADESIVTATTEYGTLIHASVERNNVFACQFHPEKSSEVGLQILRNFMKVTKEKKDAVENIKDREEA
ncbi:MAG: imidazole glycerol phosphate synthase subunit HisH [Lachnospiraceae bacterium]